MENNSIYVIWHLRIWYKNKKQNTQTKCAASKGNTLLRSYCVKSIQKRNELAKAIITNPTSMV